jgi:hypothetical protein
MSHVHHKRKKEKGHVKNIGCKSIIQAIMLVVAGGSHDKFILQAQKHD